MLGVGMMSEPDFSVWSHDTLVKFAHEALTRIREQDEVIKHLRQDFKDAMQMLRESERARKTD